MILSVLLMSSLSPMQTEVATYASQFGGDIITIARIESNFNPKALSPVGAKGVMQLMPVAIKEVYIEGCGDHQLPTKFNVWNYRHNILVGYCYFNLLRTKYKLPLRKAVAAYNLGPTRVHRRWPRETRNYVKKFFNLREKPCYNLSLPLPWRQVLCLPLLLQPVRY